LHEILSIYPCDLFGKSTLDLKHPIILMNEKLSPLKIFNASAGSGKTYHLVKEYIALLIGDERRTDAFSNIIAMTFTNKAALEMKERIITALDQISSPDHFDHKADALTAELSADLKLKTSQIVERCQTVLKLILHRYEDFHVMTIDKFNLRLIKSFSRDLDLPTDFEVVLDESELIERIVDDLFNQLGDAGNQDLNKLIFRYARSKVDEGSSWNFRRDLIQFGSILKSEKNNRIVERLLEMDFSVEQQGLLHNHKKSIDAKFQMKLEALRLAFNSTVFDKSTLPGGGHTTGDVEKVLGYTQFPSIPLLIGKRLNGNMEKEAAGKSFPAELRTALQEVNVYWESQLEEYAALELFLKNFFNMALLQYMAGALNQVKKDEQIIRISEFNTLISKLIQNEGAPFIYERLGTRFHHFLLDEFQDTSRLQWLNLVPLVHNSIAQNLENLIVGDPKQSIYRFKNGVAEQFVALPKIYNPEGNPSIARHSNYFEQMGTVIPLENNWRSSPSIVSFNNSFFEQLRTILPAQSVDFYNSVSQHPKSTINGRIHIRSFEEKTAPEALVPVIQEWIDECLAEGFYPGDLCILGGTNKTCNTWAIKLTELGYKIVSSDSLLIHSNLRVQLTIAYLQRRLKPSGENESKRFAELFFRINANAYNDYSKYIVEYKAENDKVYRKFDDAQFLNDHFDGYKQFFFKHESLYDLIQSFYRIMKYDELSDPYLHHLADIAFEFGQKRGPDLKTFLEDYHAKKHKIAVQIPESKGAVKIMTIHKSKGLEFPVVMLPSLDFGMDIKSDFLLESGDFVLYKKPAKNDVLSILQETKEHEEAQILTDNVNLCYVGMTRPIERLYIHNAYDNKKFGRIFHQVLEDVDGVIEEDSALTYTIHNGSRTSAERKDDAELMVPLTIQDKLWFPNISLQDRPELGAQDYLSEEMQFGVQFHLLMSRIQELSEVDSVLKSGIDSGEVSATNENSLREKLQILLKRADYTDLFKGATKILSEQAIIYDHQEMARPDKLILKPAETIILDYKTGLPSTKDEKQVRAYQKVLQTMGYPDVRSYLFYTSINELRLIG
jgi:ATP-dependent exoDNAse (exonuclease V) beta subunit